jgi:hypothetical protein
MGRYKQTDITGESFIRFHEAFIKNPLNTNPSISFTEEQILNIGGEEIKRPINNVAETLGLYDEENNLGEVVQLINPLTFEPIEGATMTYAEIMTSVYSLYNHLAVKRDTENEEWDNG